MKEELIRVTWHVPEQKKGIKGSIVGTKVNHLLFGYRVKYKSKKTGEIKWYIKDGLLCKYIVQDGSALMIPNVKKKGHGDYVVPKKFEKDLKRIFADLDVDHIIVPYSINTNYANTIPDLNVRV